MAEKVIFLLVFLIVFGCNKEKECPWPYPNVNIPLRENNVNWFEELPSDTNIIATSNLGRTLSFNLVPRYSFTGVGIYNCDMLYGESRFLAYSSSIYKYNFNVLVFRHWEKDKLVIGGSFISDYYSRDNKGEISLLDTANRILNITSGYRIYKNYTLDTNYSMIDTFKVKNKIYYDVLKVDFSDLKYSIDDKIKTYYLDIKFGVIRFDSFDGEIWTLNL